MPFPRRTLAPALFALFLAACGNAHDDQAGASSGAAHQPADDGVSILDFNHLSMNFGQM